MKQDDVFPELKKLSLPLLKSFQEDLLIHDKSSLASNPGVSFFHQTKKTGTRLVFFPDPGSLSADSRVCLKNNFKTELRDFLGEVITSQSRLTWDLIVYYEKHLPTLMSITQETMESLARAYVSVLDEQFGLLPYKGFRVRPEGLVTSGFFEIESTDYGPIRVPRELPENLVSAILAALNNPDES